MTTNTIPSIKTLPVEIFHRIFDYLNAQTILFSIRLVCRSFREVASSYDRFSFDFKSISQSDLHLLCRLVNPKNVISLTLCNNDHTPNQLALFLTLVRLRQFTRLHYITFLGIDEVQFNKFFKNFNVDLLTSFSLNIQNYDNRRKKTTLNLLLSIISQRRLRKLELGINNDRLADVSWPLNSTIEYLIINEYIPYDNIYNMLVSFVQLHTLIIKQNFSIAKNMIVTNSFPKLTSLTIEKLNTPVDKFESFLSMTPSLQKLKILGEGWILNGKQWEQIIETHLPHLHTFQFFVSRNKLRVQTRDDLQLIIETFQSSFWIEHKKWFVACDFIRDRPYKIQLYSIPICKYVDQYEISSERVFISNSTIKFYNDPLITTNINELIFTLKQTTTGYLDKGEIVRIGPLFPAVTKLILDINRENPLQSMSFFSSIINLSQLIQLKLQGDSLNMKNTNILLNIIRMVERSSNLTSLTINSAYHKNELYPHANALYSILPHRIKHLLIPINQLNQIKIILERCQYLSTVQFVAVSSTFSDEVCRWFTQNTIDSIFRKHKDYDTVWIGKKHNETKVHHKRIKLTENIFDS